MNYDEDQLRVINCRSKKIVVNAFAGSGKTTTSIGYAQKRLDKKILYIVLAKANQEDAKKRFPKNTSCRTSHSLAFGAVGRLYGARLVKSWKPRHVAEDMNINLQRAIVIHAALIEFFGNTDSSVSMAVIEKVGREFDVHPNRNSDLLAMANQLWLRMKNVNDTVKIVHDTYLKIWALSEPRLEYDVIVLDEAQDTNPVMTMVVLAQNHATILMIGDRHQAIFAFRGASNAMELFEKSGAEVLALPRTWRFGERTAALANALLQTYKDEVSSIVGMGQDAPFEEGKSVAFLARTNAQLFSMAAQRRGVGVYWVGGSGNYRLDLVLDAYYLFAGLRGKIQDPLLARYASWAEYCDEASRSKDVEAKILIDAVSAYGADIPVLIDDIKFNEVIDLSSAERILTTAHKSKGLDFDFVRLCEDFKVFELICDSLMNCGHITAAVKQEINLLYVGLTRAKRKVFLNSDTQQLFTHIRDEAKKYFDVSEGRTVDA